MQVKKVERGAPRDVRGTSPKIHVTLSGLQISVFFTPYHGRGIGWAYSHGTRGATGAAALKKRGTRAVIFLNKV